MNESQNTKSKMIHNEEVHIQDKNMDYVNTIPKVIQWIILQSIALQEG